jgi:hypothetical protein
MALQTDMTGATGFRPWAEAIVTAVLAAILGFFLSIVAALLIPFYATPTHQLIQALLPSLALRNAANVVLLLIVPNLVASFCWAYAALRLASLMVRPADLRLAAVLAASIPIMWAIASPFAFPRSGHILLALWMCGEVVGYMTLGGRQHEDERRWRFAQVVLAGFVLVGVVENLLLPPILLHQYFDPATGQVVEPLKPDPSLPHYHNILPPYVPK